MRMTWEIVACGLILLACTGYLSWQLAGVISFRKVLREGMHWLEEDYRRREIARRVRQYSRNPAKVPLLERMEVYFIDRSNIRSIIPFANIYLLLLLTAVIFILTFEPVYRVLRFIPTAIILCGILSMIPYLALDILCRYQSERIRRQMTRLLDGLVSWCAVREDIFFAFEKTLERGLEEPLRSCIRDMTVQVHGGLEPGKALDMLETRVGNPQFSEFIRNVKQVIKSRGDLQNLLEKLRGQFYELEQELNRRKVFTYRDRLILYGIALFLPVLVYFFLGNSEKVHHFYVETAGGNVLLALFSLLYAAGLYITVSMIRFKY